MKKTKFEGKWGGKSKLDVICPKIWYLGAY